MIFDNSMQTWQRTRNPSNPQRLEPLGAKVETKTCSQATQLERQGDLPCRPIPLEPLGRDPLLAIARGVLVTTETPTESSGIREDPYGRAERD